MTSLCLPQKLLRDPTGNIFQPKRFPEPIADDKRQTLSTASCYQGYMEGYMMQLHTSKLNCTQNGMPESLCCTIILCYKLTSSCNVPETVVLLTNFDVHEKAIRLLLNLIGT